MLKSSVISFASNVPQPQGFPPTSRNFLQEAISLKFSLDKNFSGKFLLFTRYPEGCPTHSESPFAFKPFSFLEVKKLGCELALWCDSSILVKHSIDSLFDEIHKTGYLFFEDKGESLGEYCKEEALATLNITREESFKLKSIDASIIGLNLNNKLSLEFLNEWKRLSLDGVTFQGAKWNGMRGWPKINPDSRVKGHRHDQTAASVLAHKLGMNQWKDKKLKRILFIDKINLNKS